MTQQQKIIMIIGFIIVAALFYLLKPILAPFLIAALLAYLGDPWVKRLMRWKLPRTLAAIIVFVVIMGAVLLLLFSIIPLLVRQATVFFTQLPTIINWLQQTALPRLNQYLSFDTSSFDLNNIKDMLSGHWQQAGDVALSIGKSGLAVLSWLAKILLVPVVTFYLLRDWDMVIHKAKELLPRRVEKKVITIVRECNDVLSAFFRGQLWVMFGLAIIYSIGLSIVGLNTAVLLGVMAGILTIIPYLGMIVGIVAASIAALIQFHVWLPVLYVVIVFAIGHGIENMLLTPLLVGDRIGLHPVAVIFAILVGGHLFGFIGVLVALPVAAIIMVLLRHVKQHYVQSEIYR